MHGYQAVLLALALLLAWPAYGKRLGNPFAVAGLAATAALAERGRIRIGGVTEASISVLPTVFAAAVLGPLAAIIVAAASFIGDFPLLVPRANRASTFERGAPYLKCGIYTCIRAVYGAVAGFAALAAVAPIHGEVPRLIVATVTAAVVAEPLDVSFAALTLRLRGG